MSPWRRRLRRLRLALTILLSSLVILAATVVGIAQLLLPQAALHPEKVAAFLSERLHRPVSVDRVEGSWEGTGAVLSLEGVHIAPSDGSAAPIVIGQAQLVLDFTAWAHRNRRWNEFRLSGLDLDLLHREDGSWSVSGMAGSDASSGEGANPLFDLGALVVRDTRLHLHDAQRELDLTVHADELRLLNWGSGHRLLGVLRRDLVNNAPLRVVAQYDDVSRDGELYLDSIDSDLAALLGGLHWEGAHVAEGKGDLQVWAGLRAGELQSVHAVVKLSDVDLVGKADPAAPGVNLLHLSQASATARWQRNDRGWQMDVANLRATHNTGVPDSSAFSLRSIETDGDKTRYLLQSEQMDLSTIGFLSQLPGVGSDALHAWLQEAAPQGALRKLDLDFVDASDFRIRADLHAVGVHASGKTPGISPLDASLLGDAEAVVLHLPPQAATVVSPGLFREPFVLTNLAGDLGAFRVDSALRVETDALTVDGAEFALQLRGGVELQDDGSRPLLDLYALISRADVRATRLFLPIGHMSRNAMTWLDRSLVSGKVENGRAAIHCKLEDWPLRNLAGRFEARVELHDLVLDYSPSWPRAEGINAQAEFVNKSVHVEASSGSVLGVNTNRAIADVADFNDAALALDLEGSGSGAQLLALLNASPTGKRNADSLQGVSIGGKGTAKITMQMPLKPDAPATVDGKVQLVDADLAAKKWNIDFKGAHGPVHFSERGFLAGPLELSYLERPAQFSLAIGGDVANSRDSVEAGLTGTMPVSAAFLDFQGLAWLWKNFSGNSEWNIALNIPKAEGATSPPAQLHFSSDMRGTAIRLPAPLDKAADAPLPVTVDMTLPVDGSALTVAMGDLLRMHARLPDATRPFAAAIDFGTHMPTQPPDRGILLGGHAARVDLSGWSAVGLGQGPGLLEGADVQADVALLGGHEFHDLGVTLKTVGEQAEIALHGEELEGTINLPLAIGSTTGLKADMQRLHWPESPKSEADEKADALAAVDPGAIPALHIGIGDFQLGQTRFGRTKIETTPIAGGMRVDQFDTESDAMRMQAHGVWHGDGTTNHSEFTIDLAAENIGHMLAAFGFAGVFDGGVAATQLQAGWAGTPAAFSLARVNGNLAVTVGEGRVLDVEPGVGRLFGLFSVREIPRRLALDFGDFFRSGMSFNAIKGEFRLEAGNAYTDDLHISSPAADIQIKGRTGLGVKDYDQQMIVTPRVGGTLPIVGALAAGPAGAAAGLAMQAIFNKAINHVTTARYHVEGSWEKPVITLIAKESSRRRPGADEPAGPRRR
ncbi:MAG: YhdP family protein [Tahibacter sp.]